MEVVPLSDCPVVPSWVQKVYATGRSIGAWATPLPRSCIQMPDTERQDLAVWKVAKNAKELDRTWHFSRSSRRPCFRADAGWRSCHRLRWITWPSISCRSVFRRRVDLKVIELLLFENKLQKYILYVLSNILMDLMKWNFVGNLLLFFGASGEGLFLKAPARVFPKELLLNSNFHFV